MKIWFDTEFIEDGRTIDLISIGAIREDGECYYAESLDCDLSRASSWVKENVLVHLNGFAVSRARIAADLIEFAGAKPEFWAYFADYDWVVLCQLYGTMMDLPANWPMWCRDLMQMREQVGRPELPSQISTEHHALNDAKWTKTAWEFLHSYPQRLVSKNPVSYGTLSDDR